MLHGSALPDPAPGDSARWGGRTSGLGRLRVTDDLLYCGLELPPVLARCRRMLGHGLLRRADQLAPRMPRRLPGRMLLLGPAVRRWAVLVSQGQYLRMRIIRSLLQDHKIVVQFDCHGRILGRRCDSRPQPLPEQLLVLRRPGLATGNKHADRVVDLREWAHRAGGDRRGGHANRVSGSTHSRHENAPSLSRGRPGQLLRAPKE